MTAVLQGNEDALKQGSWVFTDQGVAEKEGFCNVSQYWYPKTLSYEQGIEQVEHLRLEREDYEFSAKNVEFGLTDTGISVNIGGQTFTPNDWSARQLCNWFDTPQTIYTYYRDGDVDARDLIVRALRAGQRQYKDKDKTLLFRTYKDGTLRGVMSQKYSIIDNVWYINTLKEFIPGGRLSHWNGDADTLYGNVLIPDTIREETDSQYGGMLSISNCEIGRRVISQIPSIFRAICRNGCIWGATKGTEMRQRHIRVDYKSVKELIRDNIHKQIPLLTTGIPMLLDTHNLTTEVGMANIFAAIVKQHNMTHEIAGEFIQQWTNNSNEKTAFGVIDAVTRAGQKFSPEVWVECDKIGGELVRGSDKAWDKLTGFAKSLDEKDVQKIFGIAA